MSLFSHRLLTGLFVSDDTYQWPSLSLLDSTESSGIRGVQQQPSLMGIELLLKYSYVAPSTYQVYILIL